jgi:hypothetical protein
MYYHVMSNHEYYTTSAVRGITRIHPTCPAMYGVDQALVAPDFSAMQALLQVLRAVGCVKEGR